MASDARRNARAFALVAFASLLCACSGIKTYPNTAEKNLRVRTVMQSGSTFVRGAAAIDLYRVDAGCKTAYLGRVDLDDPLIHVGVPPNQPTFLDFIFATKGFLSPNVSATHYQTLLTPRPGYDYDVQARYVDGLYGVEIRERRRGGSGGGVVPRAPLCTK